MTIVVIGGLLGALAGPWVLDAFLAALSGSPLPGYLDLRPQRWTRRCAFVTLAIASLVAGAVPALAGKRVQPGEVMKEGGRETVGRATVDGWVMRSSRRKSR